MKTNKFWMCALAMTAFLMGACIEENEEPILPNFPDSTTSYFVEPGDTVVIPLNPTLDWQLFSDAMWCKVDGLFLDTNGKAGDNLSVKFLISDESRGFEESYANITLRMGEESMVIAKITRRALEYQMTISDDITSYDDGQSIIIGTSGTKGLHVKANFNLDAIKINTPQWISVERNENNFRLSVISDSLKYTIDNATDSIVFTKDSVFSTSLHIQYTGMDAKTIQLNQEWINATVTQDGLSYSTMTEAYNAPFEFSVAALNDGYELVLVNEQDRTLSFVSEAESWLSIADDKVGNVCISFDKNDGDIRTAYVFVFPTALSDSLVDEYALGDFMFSEIEGVFIVKDEAKSYFVGKFTQDGVMTVKFSPETQWGLSISADGKTYKNAMSVMTNQVFDSPIKVSIQATNNAYELVYLSYDTNNGYAFMSEADCWIKVQDDEQGNISIGFDANNSIERKAYLFVLTEAMVRMIANNSSNYEEGVINYLIDSEGVKGDCEQYLIAEFTQEGMIDNSFSVINGASGKWEDMPVEAETDSEWLDIAMGYYVSKEKVYHTCLESGRPYIINPMLDKELWNPGVVDGAHIQVWGKSGQQYLASNKDFIAEPAMTEDDLYYYIQYQLYIEEDHIIYFMDANKIALKALVVELAEFEE